MVNLAKLRKKAKDKKAKAEEKIPQASDLKPQESDAATDAAAPADSSLVTRHSSPEATNRIADYLATAGESRVEAARAEDTGGADQLELLTFVIAGEQYAIDIDQVVEIVTPRPVTRVPNADRSVVGIFSLRGTVVVLIDARRRLGHSPAASSGPDTRVVVVHQDSENVGFVVDRVLRVVKVDRDGVEAPPAIHSSEYGDSVKGVFRQGEALTILLDLSDLVFTANEWN